MTIEQAKLLVVGDKLTHNGVWAYHASFPRTYEVISNDEFCIRVRERDYVSHHEWTGCSVFVTRDFFASCTKLGEQQ